MISCLLVLVATIVICGVVIAGVVQIKKRQGKDEGEPSLEVKPEDVDIGAELGKGNFGTVYKGTLKDSRQVN